MPDYYTVSAPSHNIISAETDVGAVPPDVPDHLAAFNALTPLQTALLLESKGFWVVPHYAGTKKPIGRLWGSTRRSADDLVKVWAARPDADLAVALGPYRAPGGGWLIDLEVNDPIDAPPVGEESLRALFDGDPAPTLSWRSRKGLHRLYTITEAVGWRWKDVLKNRRLADFPAVEFLVGGYKADGVVKQVKATAPPTRTDDFRRAWTDVGDPAPLPDDVVEYVDYIVRILEMTAHMRKPDVYARPVDDDDSSGAEDADGGVAWREFRRAAVAAYVRKIDPAVSGCGGSATTYRAACAIVARGVDRIDDVVYLLRQHHNPRCAPPWTMAELRHKAEDAVRAVVDRAPADALRRSFLVRMRRTAIQPSIIDALDSHLDCAVDLDDEDDVAAAAANALADAQALIRSWDDPPAGSPPAASAFIGGPRS